MSKIGERILLTHKKYNGKIYQKNLGGIIMVDENTTERVCSLYVNNMHLIVMLVPYIERELEKGSRIITVLQEDLENEVKTLISKVNLNKRKKEKLKKINWKKNFLSMSSIEEIKNKTILVKGDYDFIKEVNKHINHKKCKVINCFELQIFEDNSREILTNHDTILNTLGERKISDMFHKNMSKNIVLTK